MENLKAAKVDRADVLFSLTTDDNTNFMISMVAKHVFGVKRVVSRVYDPTIFPFFKNLE